MKAPRAFPPTTSPERKLTDPSTTLRPFLRSRGGLVFQLPPPVHSRDRPASGGGVDPSIEDIVSQLDRAVGASSARRPVVESTVPAMPTTVETAAATIAATTEAGVATGFLTARRARVVRGSDGTLMAVVDSGSSGKSEGPMTLLPCQNLAAIEAIMDGGAEGTSFTLTGEVFAYRGKRYLLPTMYHVNRASDNINSVH